MHKKEAKNVKKTPKKHVLVVSCVALRSVIGANTFSFLLTSPLASPRCLVCVFPPLTIDGAALSRLPLNRRSEAVMFCRPVTHSLAPVARDKSRGGLGSIDDRIQERSLA